MTTTTRERPILFKGEMVKAILSGAKTQTRRVIKPQPPSGATWSEKDRLFMLPGSSLGVVRTCRQGSIGDRLWVRETWGLRDTRPSDGPGGATVFYRASDSGRHELRHQLWRPSIHMPRWASRITLEITGVRVERLQDISPRDAWAEGVRCSCMCPVLQCKGNVDAYQWLWDVINGKSHPWASNPRVWTIEFRKVEGER